MSSEPEGNGPRPQQGWVIIWGQVQRQLEHTRMSRQGHQESSREGFLVLKEVLPSLSPEGPAGDNQVKGGGPL